MSVTLAINSIVADDPARGIDKTQSALIVEGSLTLSGNYGGASPAHGDAINFKNARITSTAIPRKVRIFQYAAIGVMPVHYSFQYAYGTTQANGEMTVIDLTTGLEITQGAAYPTTLTAAGVGIRFEAWFPLFIG